MKLFLKKRVKYYFFFLGIMILTAVIGAIVPDFIYFKKQEVLTDRKIELRNVSKPNEKNKYLWWEVENEKIILNVAKANTDKILKVYGIKYDNKSDEIPINSKSRISSIDPNFSGGFNSSLAPFKLDPDNKESKKTVYVNAKIDTIFVRGFIPRWTIFEKEKIQMDINRVDEHHISISYKGKFLANKDINVSSARGLNKNITLNDDGIVKIENIKDFRSGIIITYIENDSINIASYISEGNTLFSKNHFTAIYPLFFIIALSAEIILIIIITKQHILLRKNTLPEIKP